MGQVVCPCVAIGYGHRGLDTFSASGPIFDGDEKEQTTTRTNTGVLRFAQNDDVKTNRQAAGAIMALCSAEVGESKTFWFSASSDIYASAVSIP
jgi:hypothetical protein